MTDKIDELKTQFKEMEEKLKETFKNVEVSEWSFKVAKVEGDIYIEAAMQVKIPKKQ